MARPRLCQTPSPSQERHSSRLYRDTSRKSHERKGLQASKQYDSPISKLVTGSPTIIGATKATVTLFGIVLVHYCMGVVSLQDVARMKKTKPPCFVFRVLSHVTGPDFPRRMSSCSATCPVGCGICSRSWFPLQTT